MQNRLRRSLDGSTRTTEVEQRRRRFASIGGALVLKAKSGSHRSNESGSTMAELASITREHGGRSTQSAQQWMVKMEDDRGYL